MARPVDSNNFLALDVGNARIGVAVANAVAKLPQPLITVRNDETVFDKLAELIASNEAGTIVVGLPRNLDGDATLQTAIVEQFVVELQAKISLPIVMQDEALTSVKAEKELDARRKPYAKEDVDALAATYILDDYLQTKE